LRTALLVVHLQISSISYGFGDKFSKYVKYQNFGPFRALFEIKYRNFVYGQSITHLDDHFATTTIKLDEK
jgi:hypothetical protein